MNRRAIHRVLFCCLIGSLLFSQLPGSPIQVGHAQEINPEKIYFPNLRISPPPRWFGPDGGSVVALASASNNPSIVYAGTFGAGVFRSNNGGASWSSAWNGLGVLKIDSLAVDPSNSEIVYAGTHGGGVYKTTNGGVYWAAVNNGIHNEAVVYTVTVNPGNPNLVYAGTRGAPGSSGPPWGGILYKSSNGGASWAAVLRDVGGSGQQDWVYSVRVNPINPEQVLAATHEHGPYLSNDYGNSGSWRTPDTSVDGSGRAVGFDPRSWKNTAFYATWHREGVFRSTNHGSTWQQSSSGLGDAKIYPNGLVFEPNNPDSIYLASFSDAIHGVMKSENGGSSWFLAGLSNRYIYSVITPGLSRDVVIAGTLQDGAYRSTDGGRSWQHAYSGITSSDVSGIVFPGSSTYIASTMNGGIFRSNDSGATWAEYNPNLSDRSINGLVIHPSYSNVIYALTNNSGLQRIDLNSGVWVQSGPPLSKFSSSRVEKLSLPAMSEEPMVELLGYQPEAVPARTTSVSAPILSLAFASSNPNIAYLGTNGSGIYISIDSGFTWGPTALGGVSARSVAIHPTNPALAYAATTQGGLVKTTSNQGGSWLDLPLIPGSPAVYSLAIPGNDPGILYAGTSVGVWKYDSAGWAALGLQWTAVTVLKENPFAPGKIFAGTPVGAFGLSAPGAWTAVVETTGYGIQTVQFAELSGARYMFFGTNNRGTLQIILN